MAGVVALGHQDHVVEAQRDELLRWLGFKNVQRTGEKVTAAEPAQLPGFLLTQGAGNRSACAAR